ncbi:protein TIC236, chloroplastic [Impatiens glandulifera]|uniref:protein TIC236, chloroplastic n=1 Tax=Impatiens glandulifera TaxID=253017 RepID=UPI001FB1A030|nr:protein TIC236, chloroplastic [Impatiens glandulifera]
MSCSNLHTVFLGFPPHHFQDRRRNRNLVNVDKLERKRRRDFRHCACARNNHWLTNGIRFSQFSEQNIEPLWKNIRFRSGAILNCVKGSFSGSKALVRSLNPLLEEGLFLIRCSVFFAVISGVCLLVWYGKAKAKSFIETKLLPSVCSVISEQIQREVDFGKVKRVSLLSITLESCSIGPHVEEFSCGEVPTVKLRILPFASLKRGKIVLDAVLYNPSLLVAQQRNYTWLGIPFIEGSLQRHVSTEEGIDHRTKIRRIAREEVATGYDQERDNAAIEAAKAGYTIPETYPTTSELNLLKENVNRFTGLPAVESFFCMNEQMHWRDHHSMDAGVEYDLKHADLEKSFGVKAPGGSVFKFWSKLVPVSVRKKFKRGANGKDLSVAGITSKRRLLERSASKASLYFSAKSKQGSDDFKMSSMETTIENEGKKFHTEHMTAHIEGEKSAESVDNIGRGNKRDISVYGDSVNTTNLLLHPFIDSINKLNAVRSFNERYPAVIEVMEAGRPVDIGLGDKESADDSRNVDGKDNTQSLGDQAAKSAVDMSRSQEDTSITNPESISNHNSITIGPFSINLGFAYLSKNLREVWSYYLADPIMRLKSEMAPKVEDIVAELTEGVDQEQALGIDKMLPVTLDSVYFKDGTLMLLAYGDKEARVMEHVDGHVKFQKHYGRIHVQLSGFCSMWRSSEPSEDGGWLSADVFVDIFEQKWHANLKVMNLFAPLFERILEIPIMWSKGRASGEVHICMTGAETFPNLHGQLDVTGLDFQIYDAPSSFSNMSASLCFRGQRIFLHNTSGWFGSVPLEASGDFGIHPEEGEFHLMCQVPHVEVNSLMRTFKMKPLVFPVAGSITAVFNCQGPLDAPVFVGSGLVSRKINSAVSELPVSAAFQALMKNKEAGAVAAFDRVPFSYVSANFTFNSDNCVADLYGIRASLVDGGEIRGAGNAWICPEGEMDDTAFDVNFSGNLCFDNIVRRYLPGSLPTVPFRLGELNGETKVSGSLLKPRFDIKWTAPKAEGSFADARGDIIISPDHITVVSSSIAFDLSTKVMTSYPDDYWLNKEEHDMKSSIPLTVEGVELDLRMRGFEFFSLGSSYPFDSLRPIHLKGTGRIKFQGNVVKPSVSLYDQSYKFGENAEDQEIKTNGSVNVLVGEVSIVGLKLNQLMLAPQLVGVLSISRERIKLDASGRPDESLAVEVVGPFQHNIEDNLKDKTLSFSLQKGQLKANACYRSLHSANLEIRHLPLDELELASLRGTMQRAEFQLNFQKRRGHGVLSVLKPKFRGVLGEALDLVAKWSGDVITVEKAILEQSNSQYELQGEYVLPGTRDRNPAIKEKGSLFERAMAGHLGNMIASVGRWRMRLIVPRAEIAEMLPLARLLSRNNDPAVQSRSKAHFIQNLQNAGVYAESLHTLLEEIREHCTALNDVILEDLSLPGLSELKGRWNGNFDASGGGNGDTMAEFDFHGDEWEWGTYKTQRLLASGAYSNNDGLRLDKMFIQKDNATVHADGTLSGPKRNLHFAVLNFPINLVPTLVQVVESSALEMVHSLRELLNPIRGILHMEGDLRGSLIRPECDVQVRLLDGSIGGIDLGRAEVVASLTSTSRFLFNAKFEPAIQNGHVHVQGSVPVSLVQTNVLEEEKIERENNEAAWITGWSKDKSLESENEVTDKKTLRDRNEEGWDTQMAETLKGLNWNILDVGEVRVDADIKDGGMMLLTALSPYANWLQGNADVMLQVRGTVDQPVIDGSAYFHRAIVSSPVLRKPLTNLGGTIHVNSNRLCIASLESRVSRKGKLSVKGDLPLRTSEASLGDKVDLKCEALEVRAKNILGGQVDTQLQITGSILQPNITGNIKLSHGEAYIPHDKGSGTVPLNKMPSNQPRLSSGGYNRLVGSKYVSRFFSFKPAASENRPDRSSGKQKEVEKENVQVDTKPHSDIRLNDLRLVLGPELRIVYPLILNFAVSGELELNGIAHPKMIKPKGILAFENGDINLVATQVRLRREHLNVARFEPDYGLDPMLDLALVGSEWQFRIQSRASNWQDKLVVTSTRSVEQDVLSPTEAARVFESQLSESILEGDGQLAFKKLATATLETLMPRIEGKGEFGQARWRLVYAPQIPSLLSVDPTADPLKSLANNISFGTEVEVQLGRRLQASVVRQMKDSEMAMQWTLIYQLTSRLRLLLQSAPSKRLIFEYSTTSRD